MKTYYIHRFVKAPLRVDHEGPPPCLYCGEPVTALSTDGPLVCGLCSGKLTLHGTPRLTSLHHAHFRYCVDHIVATQPEGRYPDDAGPEWFVGRVQAEAGRP